MPATPAATPKPKQRAGAPTPSASANANANAAPSTPTPAQPIPDDKDNFVRLHITPFNPALLNAYIPPSVVPVAKNISYHSLETFPEKGFGYVELPAMEAQKLKKKLNGSTLKGSKVRIEEAKPEKRKAGDVVDVEAEEVERAAKRAKKEKKRKRKEDGVLEGVQLPEERKVKRGWTEVPVKGKKERTEKKDKKEEKRERKKSKYTKEPELLFKAKLTPVAATEVARKEKKDKKKKDKKDKSKREVVVHEFEKNTKTPSFLKATAVSTDKKAAVDYVNDKGWVDEEGNVVEVETVKAKNRRVLELVEPGPEEASPKSKKKVPATPSPKGSPAPKSAKKDKKKAKQASRSPESSESEESSVVSSSSSSGSDSDSDSEASAGASEPASPAAASTPAKAKSNTPEIAITPSSPAKKEIHPLEALFKKPKPAPLLTPSSNPISTPAKGLAPINTSFSFFDGEPDADVDMENGDGDNAAVPFTPQTQRDIEWRGLRSAAPTPDTAAIGKRFSFPWRNGSQEADDDDEDQDADIDASTQLSNNTKANATASQLADVVEEDEEEAEGIAGADDEKEEEGEKEETEFRKWFWENQGNLNRAWKRRRKDAVKTKRSVENKRAVGGARRGA